MKELRVVTSDFPFEAEVANQEQRDDYEKLKGAAKAAGYEISPCFTGVGYLHHIDVFKLGSGDELPTPWGWPLDLLEWLNAIIGKKGQQSTQLP